MSQPVKIQINSLEALERLIGGDSQLEIEVRNNIVQEFTNKHLKGLVKEMSGWRTQVLDEAKRVATSASDGFLRPDSWRSVTLTEDAKLKIRNSVTSELNDQLYATIEEKIKMALSDKALETLIENLVTRLVGMEVQKIRDKVIAKLVA